MSKISLSGNPSGTATFTIESPATNTDRTLVLPDAAGTVLTSASDLAAAQLTGNIAAARITNALNASGSAPVYACRAWVNFNGTTSPGTIRASGNVSSVVKNAVGNYTVNLTTAMPDTNGGLAASGGLYFDGSLVPVQGPQVRMDTASTILVRCGSNVADLRDLQECYVQVFR